MTEIFVATASLPLGNNGNGNAAFFNTEDTEIDTEAMTWEMFF